MLAGLEVPWFEGTRDDLPPSGPFLSEAGMEAVALSSGAVTHILTRPLNWKLICRMGGLSVFKKQSQRLPPLEDFFLWHRKSKMLPSATSSTCWLR